MNVDWRHHWALYSNPADLNPVTYKRTVVQPILDYSGKSISKSDHFKKSYLENQHKPFLQILKWFKAHKKLQK